MGPAVRVAGIVGRRLVLAVATVLAAWLLAAVLIRLAPGLGMDERRLDLRLSQERIASLEDQARSAGAWHYLRGLARGDWGTSLSLGRPVRELLAERAGTSMRTLAAGLTIAWTAGLALCFALQWLRRESLEVAATVLTGAMLCLPAAVVALVFLYHDGGPALALAAILLPRVFRYTRNILDASARRLHVLAARARGIGPPRLLWRYVLVPVQPELLALAGVSVSMAVGAVIPVEALCDSPGVGQLVWQSALARDLPVLLHLTVLVALVTCAANLVSDAARAFAAEAA
jgi:ABC-type dipeptide/oligopeptide/nickel transport system permease component